MPDGLYEHDVLTWSEQQADLLRRLAGGERVNAAIDWDNLIEEVASVGRAQLNACESLLEQALLHMMKLHAWPCSEAAVHWQIETIGFLGRARRIYAPSMRQRIDLAALYAVALRQVRLMTDSSGAASPLPKECPVTIDALLDRDADILDLARLSPG